MTFGTRRGLTKCQPLAQPLFTEDLSPRVAGISPQQASGEGLDARGDCHGKPVWQGDAVMQGWNQGWKSGVAEREGTPAAVPQPPQQSSVPWWDCCRAHSDVARF